MKKNLLIVSFVVLIMLSFTLINSVLADGISPGGIPVGKPLGGQAASTNDLGAPVGVKISPSTQNLASSYAISEPQTQPTNKTETLNKP